MMRTNSPQPAGQSGQILGFQRATPGVSVSSGINRTSCLAGSPQPARAPPAPVTAVSLMKLRRSISVVTGEAVVGRLLFLMTVDAKAHRVIDRAPRDRHTCDIAVAVRTLHLSANVWSVIEAHRGLFDPAVDALPG